MIDSATSSVEPLFRSEFGRLVGLARLLVDERTDAEEIVQEAFVRLILKWRSLDDPGRADAWLRSTVVNLARGRLRRRRIARRHESWAPPSASSDAEADVVRDDDAKRLREQLARLPSRQRECLVFRYWLDCSNDEIAPTLGISVGSVKTHVHRGLKAMGVAYTDEAASVLPVESKLLSRTGVACVAKPRSEVRNALD